MNNGNRPQTKLSMDEVLKAYAETGIDPSSEYGYVFWERYNLVYFTPWGASIPTKDKSDYALVVAIRGMPWFILYARAGHPEQWCFLAWRYGAYRQRSGFGFEDFSECLWEVYRECHEKALKSETRNAVKKVNIELRRHCDYLKQRFGKSDVYMRLFFNCYKKMQGGADNIPFIEQKEREYNDTINKEKD